jgi:hypothetical protein
VLLPRFNLFLAAELGKNALFYQGAVVLMTDWHCVKANRISWTYYFLDLLTAIYCVA